MAARAHADLARHELFRCRSELGVRSDLAHAIIEGELFVSPRPASPHAFAAFVLGAWLHRYFGGGGEGPGGWWILPEPELHLGRDILVPDFAGWRRSRMPVLPDVRYFTIA